jgi:heptose-I-phosphate ethanolaminephosphotransferase
MLLGRAFAFCSLPAIYLALGWINWSEAGKLALLGTPAVVAASAWTTRCGAETKAGKRGVLIVAIPFLFLMGFHAFLRDLFGVAADDNVVCDAVFGTNTAEAVEFVQQYSLNLVTHVGIFLACVLGFGCVLHRWPSASHPGTPGRTVGRRRMAAAAFLALFLLIHLNPSMRKEDPLLYLPLRYASWKNKVESFRHLQERMGKAATDPQLASLHLVDQSARTVVFVLGESVTRSNFTFAGYPRHTSPELDAMGAELTWFTDVVSCDGSTVPAISKILSPATLSAPDLYLEKPDVLLMANKVGYKTFWISNHGTDADGVISIMAAHADKLVLANRGGSRGEGSFDEVVFPAFTEALRDPAPRKLIILHLLQAHPAYYYRYPKGFARFNDADDAVTRQLKQAGRAFWAVKMRNYYDNALLYADHVLKRSINFCQASGQPVAWLFVPDHGQDAAHYNNFSGHNMRVRSQYEIPMVYWQSPSFPRQHGAAIRGRPYQTDVLDHTLLGLMGIAGDYYDPRCDILSDQFVPAPRFVFGQPYP